MLGAAAVALAGCAGSSSSSSATTSRAARSAPAPSSTPAKAKSGSPYVPGSRFDLAYQRGRAECGYLRHSSRWPVERAVRVIRAESMSDFKNPAAIGCEAAYR